MNEKRWARMLAAYRAGWAPMLEAYARRWMPEGATPADAEREVMATLQEVAPLAVAKFVFPGHPLEDAVAQAILETMPILAEKYDPSQPLANFAFVHMKNRSHNYKRDHYSRPDRPCTCCDPKAPPPDPCPAMAGWLSRNRRKRSLAGCGGAAEDSDFADEGGTEALAESSELEARVDALLPAPMRADYLRLRAGGSVPQERRDEIRAVVAAILGIGNGDVEAED